MPLRGSPARLSVILPLPSYSISSAFIHKCVIKLFIATVLSDSVGESLIPIDSRFQKSSMLGFCGSDLSIQVNNDVSRCTSVPYVSINMLGSNAFSTFSEVLPDKIQPSLDPSIYSTDIVFLCRFSVWGVFPRRFRLVWQTVFLRFRLHRFVPFSIRKSVCVTDQSKAVTRRFLSLQKTSFTHAQILQTKTAFAETLFRQEPIRFT